MTEDRRKRWVGYRRYYEANRSRLIEKEFVKYHSHTDRQRRRYYGCTLQRSRKGRSALADWYVRKVAALNAGISAKEVTPLMMQLTRERIEAKRTRRQNKILLT